jgi:hypothetical protein
VETVMGFTFPCDQVTFRRQDLLEHRNPVRAPEGIALGIR